MARLLTADGAEAAPGSSSGLWLGEGDFVSTAGWNAMQLGSLGFPRDWPTVYSVSKPFKSLIGSKKGRCAGKKVSVLPVPLPEDLALLQGLVCYPLQSFSNAVRIEKAAGLPVIRGWAVFEHLDLAVSEAFVAERYWWNALPDGRWVDCTPRPEAWPEMVLAEAVDGAPKEPTILRASEFELAQLLLGQRFPALFLTPPLATPLAVAALQAEGTAMQPEPGLWGRDRDPEPGSNMELRLEPGPKPGPESGDSSELGHFADPSSAPLSELVKVAGLGNVAALKELTARAQDDEALCIKLVGHGMIASLVQLLSKDAKREDALRLLVLVTDAGVGTRDSQVAASAIAAGVVPLAAGFLSSGSLELQNQAAAVLGNLCHESPVNQNVVARAGVFRPLVEMLSADDINVAQEAAYAIWNLTVNHSANSTEIVRLGAVPKLTELLKSPSDVAQENAAGALMHVTMSEEARATIVKANAIPRLCELLCPSCEPEVSSQAAGALLNLASDCQEYANLIVKQGAVSMLVDLVKDGPDLAREYSAGALMNLARGEADVAEKAAKHGAIPALAALLLKPFGHSESLGALANLASGSSERQIAIYKAQVTRKTVAFLSDPDIDVRRSAAALLMNLAPHTKIKERIVEAGALQPLVGMLRDGDVAVRERATGALANLLNDHSATVTAANEQAPEIIPSLIEILTAPNLSEDARRQAAHALAMLAAEDGPGDEILAAGAGPPLLNMLREGVAEAALGIMNLSWRRTQVKDDLAKGDTLENLIKLLKSSDAMAKEYAAGALMNITAGSEELAVKAVPAVISLVGMLRAESIQAAEWAAGALANILKAGPDAQKVAADSGAIPPLVALLLRVTVAGRTLVVLALAALANSQAPAIQKELTGTKERAKLREFQDSGNEELKDYVKTLAEKLGSSFNL